LAAALLILLAAVLGGAVATYLYEERAGAAYRIACGACLGMTVLGLAGYVAASTLGMGPLALALAALLTLGVPLWLVRDGLARLLRQIRAGIRRPPVSRVAWFLAVFVVLWLCYDRAMIVKDDGIYTGYIDNYADLTLHLGIITGFVYGENYPPEHPEYAGTRLAYPFLVDFVAAMLVAAGAPIHQAMFLQNMVLTPAMLVIFYVWGRRLTGDRAAALLVPALVFLCGGLGFSLLLAELKTAPDGIWHYLLNLPHDYTAHESRFRWANALVYWFVPMRSMLLGVPLFLIVTGLWWKALGYEVPDPLPAETGKTPNAAPAAGRKRKKAARATAPVAREATAEPTAASTPAPNMKPERIMAGAGVITGLLVLGHAHTCMTLCAMGPLMMLLTRRWRMWIVFGAIAFVLVLPQGLWAISGTSAEAGKFVGWYPGWSGHESSTALVGDWLPGAFADDAPITRRLTGRLLFGVAVAWYWFLNTGLFIPLLAVALLWRGSRALVPRRLLLFYLPFLLCFILPNLWKIAPWEWDNIKVLIYWFIPSTPLVALLLVRWWRGGTLAKAVAAFCFVVLTLSGGIDIWRVLTRTLEWRDFDAGEIALGELIRTSTPPRAVLLNAPLHNHPFLLSGRRSFFGYPGTLWTHGIVYTDREQVTKQIYEGAPEAKDLIRTHGIDYVVIGPMERNTVKPLNEAFFEQFPKVAQSADSVIYKVR
jgi:hypothetical protein